MTLLKLLNSTTFRMALIYMIFFAASVFALLIFIYWSTTSFMARQSDETVAAEIIGITEQLRSGGVRQLIQVIQRRSRAAEDSLYLLVQADGTYVAGNIGEWPDAEKDKEDWIEFEFERLMDEGPEIHMARARVFEIQGTLKLLVGRDIQSRLQIQYMIRNSLLWAMVIMSVLGLGGGGFLARHMMGRLDVINRTSRRIVAGDLTRRIPLRGSGDEIDQLAENLNDMLTQIERLMMGMKQVTDNIAHDLRSPLNRMRNRIEVTLLEEDRQGAYESALRHTIEEADGVIKTFNALLSIAQVEAGALRDEMKDLNLAALAFDVAELYEPVAEDKNIAFSTDIEGPVNIRGNRELLSQSLANLLDNAIKYAPEGGAVSLALSDVEGNKDQIQLVVTDTGPGIPEVDYARVAERFVRLEDSRSEKGSGLGLSLVSAVARIHQGRLELGAGGANQDGGNGLRASFIISRNAHSLEIS